jgi:hypothetical protein
MVIVGLFLAAALPLICTNDSRGRAAADQNAWHLPTIRKFIREWPRPDLRDYDSATTPGYHFVLAAASRALGRNDERTLRLLGSLFTVGFLATLAVVAGRRGTAAAIVLCLPALASLYIYSSAVWILPDNMGWWGVLLGLLLALRRRVDRWTYIATAILMSILVLIRQIDLWVAAPLCVSAWLGTDEQTTDAPTHRHCIKSAAIRSGGILLATLPALVILALFIRLWHGLVPPTFQTGHSPAHRGAGQHTGANPAAPALAFATVAMMAPFYLAWFWPAQRPRRIATWVGLGAGFIAGAAPNTTYSMDAGRWSGTWYLARLTPSLASRSPAIIVLATLGGGILGWIIGSLEWRTRWIILSAWIAYLVAQYANHQAWQRYVDPFVIIILVLAASRADVSCSTPRSRLAMMGLPILLAALLCTVTILSLR